LIRNPNSSASVASGGSHLGPNPELLRRKDEAERKAEAERRNRTRADLSTMTEEERLRKIQAMQADADQNDALRASRLSSAAARTTTREDEHTGKASFLQSMRKEVYTSGSVDMSKRIDQNKNSRQSSADIDSAEGFIRKG
jgi:tagatose-1,6-bisphosphate aldolase non-catalytic subunit AgaZ/GatZ